MFKGNPYFSWSPFRENIFNECELCYAMHYYTAHKGWLRDNPVKSRAAYRWKQASRIDQVISASFIDGLIEEVYSDENFSARRLQKKVMNDLNTIFNESISQKDGWYNNPKRVVMLYELVYEDKLDEGIIRKSTKSVNQLIKGFLDSKFIKELSEDDSELIDISSEFKSSFTYFELEELGIRAYARAHTIHKLKNGTVVITLFKTDNNESTISQIGAVAKLIGDNTDINLQDIIVRDEFLLSGEHKDNPITKDVLDMMYLSIEDSVSMMSEFLVDNDIHKNEFKGLNNIDYTRNLEHYKQEEELIPMSQCSYCEAVRRDLQIYPNGYDKEIENYRGFI